jgi:hypothetical protein
MAKPPDLAALYERLYRVLAETDASVRGLTTALR